MEPSGDETTPFPPSPAGVPADLTEPSAAYKRHAWIAVAGLLAFVGVYLGLTGYLAWLVWNTLGRALMTGQHAWLAFFVSLPAAFFLAFLVRGLFVVRHEQPRDLVEVRPETEPALFAFLHRLADETRAPRPHRVFLSPRVNAAVFYDLSFWNLLIPSKKNLELGLGLVNALSLDELKAVVAHEYGHFAQRTMAVGRWVYVARQIAGHIVGARGAFDAILQFLSNIDLRVAWIGWILRLFVWAIRAVLDTMLRLVILAQRALGREMELQADRVAVSVSGSDSLIHALHRLGPADEAWADAIAFTNDEWRAGRGVEDLFALQSAVLDQLRHVLDDARHGLTPRVPDDDRGAHRVFETTLAQPPRMWMTHPPNREREDSAKAVYVPSPVDARPAWTLFRDPEARRREVTARLLSLFGQDAKGKVTAPPKPTVPIETTLARLEERWARPCLEPRFRGAYLGRDIAAYWGSSDAMVAPAEPRTRDEVLAAIDACYPESLRDELARFREQREEVKQLEGLVDGALSAPGGVIRHRGREIPRRDLPDLLEAARRDRDATQASLSAHDARARRAHLDAAALLGEQFGHAGWDDYLASLRRLLHYTTHAWRDLADVHGYLHHQLRIVLADGHVSSRERHQILGIAGELHDALSRLWRDRDALHLPPAVAARFADLEGFTAMKDPLRLPPPNEQQLGDWLSVMDSWTYGAIGDLRVLADVALDTLLEHESSIARQLREGIDPGDAPDPAKSPRSYHTLVVGRERERQKTLGAWDRFQTADGFLPGLARFAAASALLLPALVLGARVGSATIVAFNGLPITVVVTVDGVARTLSTGTRGTWEHGVGGAHIETRTLGGETIESFDADVASSFGTFAYSVAQAVPLVEWTAVYGSARPRPEERRGAPRWLGAPEDAVFTEPPSQVEVSHSSGGAARTVLTGVVGLSPAQALSLVTDPEERDAMVRAHLRYEPVGSRFVADWLLVAAEQPAWIDEVRHRVDEGDAPVVVQRALLDLVSEDERARRCDALAARANERDDADALYLAIRCRDDGPERDSAFLEAYARHPDAAWLAYAAASTLGGRGEWDRALDAYLVALSALETAGVHDAAELFAWRVLRARRIEDLYARSDFPAPAQDGTTTFLRAIENGARADDPRTEALRALSDGQLALAVQLLPSDAPGEEHDRVVVLAGCSDGATSAQIQAALAVSPTRVAPLAPILFALAAREHEDTARYATVLASDPLGAALADLLADEGLATHPHDLEAVAAQNDAWWRGLALTAGVVRLGADAPPRWRAEARALLFGPERPYLAPPPPALEGASP